MLQLKGITKNYLSGDNEVKALKGIDLEFRESTKIDKEYRDIKSENIISLIEDIKYIY